MDENFRERARVRQDQPIEIEKGGKTDDAFIGNFIDESAEGLAGWSFPKYAAFADNDIRGLS